jgi:DNA-binding CsgD family transcriptional regulator
MDQLADSPQRPVEDPRAERIAAACRSGLILVDARGNVLWMDEATRRCINGGLHGVTLPVARPDDPASDNAVMDCFLTPVEITLDGERVTLCAIQETVAAAETQDLIKTLESVMADSTSWLTRTVIDRLKALRLAKRTETPPATAHDLDLLSDREREVLGLICEGRGDAQMSRILGLSENTVRNHIASLYRKIGVNRRTAAIIWARERGIASSEALAVRQRRRPPNGANGNGANGNGSARHAR